MSDQRRYRALDRLYAQVPSAHCKGLCGPKVCGPIPCTDLEKQRIVEQTGPKAMLDGPTCPWLDAGGRCTVYAIRPLICRLWGAVDESRMRCMFGCKPDRWVTREESVALLKGASRLGGPARVLASGPLVMVGDDNDVADAVYTKCDTGCGALACGFTYDAATGRMVKARCDAHIDADMRKTLIQRQVVADT